LFDTFDSMQVDVGEARIFARVGGSGSPLVLLHGFPETHLMWRRVASVLARHHRVIVPDLRGYGASSCPPSSDDHAPYSKRTMARDIVLLMSALGHDRFALAGHDRGGRVAYRLAFDHPDKVNRLALLDILPTDFMWECADARLVLAFWPWSLLAQPASLPERLLTAAPDAIVEDALSNWDTPADCFPDEVRQVYVEQLRDERHAHAICEEYRAAATLDREHDRADRQAGRRIGCDLLLLWSEKGGLEKWYKELGGPLAIWRELADRVTGQAIDGGHFFPEENDRTAEALAEFFGVAD
jgi:haloacetate dehalogenase